jgi:hypothetical protein
MYHTFSQLQHKIMCFDHRQKITFFVPCRFLSFCVFSLLLTLDPAFAFPFLGLVRLSSFCPVVSFVSLLFLYRMAPANKKKGVAAVPPCPDSKRQAVSNNKGAKKAPTKKTVAKQLSSHGFLSPKRPEYKLRTKLLLDTSIYNDEIPEKVVDHMFVYEIVELVSKDGKTIKIQYQNQVIRDGGNKFRKYKDLEESQVSSAFVICLFFICYML